MSERLHKESFELLGMSMLWAVISGILGAMGADASWIALSLAITSILVMLVCTMHVHSVVTVAE